MEIAKAADGDGTVAGVMKLETVHDVFGHVDRYDQPAGARTTPRTGSQDSCAANRRGHPRASEALDQGAGRGTEGRLRVPGY